MMARTSVLKRTFFWMSVIFGWHVTGPDGAGDGGPAQVLVVKDESFAHVGINKRG